MYIFHVLKDLYKNGEYAMVYESVVDLAKENIVVEQNTIESLIVDKQKKIAELETNIASKEAMIAEYEEDLKYKSTQLGIHRDDLLFKIDDKPLSVFASQGQMRLCIIATKLALLDLSYKSTGSRAIVVFDDVLSELDPQRQDFVLNQISSGQVFITCCEPGRFTKLGKTIEIEKGKVVF